MLSVHLTYLIEAQEPIADLSRLAEHLPYEWNEYAVRVTWTRQDAAHDAFKGLSLRAMNGTTLRTPDSPANRERFEAQGYASGKAASYPQVRAVRLTGTSTHLVADINFDRYDTNEIV